jgi:hypothetical protein
MQICFHLSIKPICSAAERMEFKLCRILIHFPFLSLGGTSKVARALEDGQRPTKAERYVGMRSNQLGLCLSFLTSWLFFSSVKKRRILKTGETFNFFVLLLLSLLAQRSNPVYQQHKNFIIFIATRLNLIS